MYVHTYPSFLDLPPPLPSCHHSPLGHHRAPSWAPRYTAGSHQLSVLHTVTYIYATTSFPIYLISPPHLSMSTCLFSMSVSLFSSVQSLSRVWLFVTHKPQYARPPCPSPTPGVHPNPCPLCRWCHPTISSSVVPFSSFPQSFPASGSFQMSQLSASGGQSSVSTTALQTGSLYHFSRFHIYALIYSMSFFLSDLLHSVWESPSPSTSLKMIQLHSF